MQLNHWWEADEWAGGRPMEYPDHRASARFRRVALTTDPEMVRTKNGALKLRLVNRHPHEALRIFVAPGRC